LYIQDNLIVSNNRKVKPAGIAVMGMTNGTNVATYAGGSFEGSVCLSGIQSSMFMSKNTSNQNSARDLEEVGK